MPLGEVIGAFTLKATSVKIHPATGDRTKFEVNFMGEVTGRLAGQGFGTYTFKGVAGGAGTWLYAGSILTTTGATIVVSGQGIAVPAGVGHRSRIRGTASYSSSSPDLASLNGLIGAVEGEGDPATLTLKGAVCEWK